MFPRYFITVHPDSPCYLPEGSYIVERQNAGEIMATYDGVDIDTLHNRQYRTGFIARNVTPPVPGDVILFVRPGGFGDLLFATPTLAAIKAQFPDNPIWFACIPKFAPALWSNPHVDRIIDYPVPAELWSQVRFHVWMERILEEGEECKEKNAVDLIAEKAGVELTEGKELQYFITDEERAWAATTYPKRDETLPRVGIQIEASAKCRSYDMNRLMIIASTLVNRGCDVFLFADVGRIQNAHWHYTVVTEPSFRNACAVLSTCDAVLAPDSALCHIAGALSIPTVALYGPFPWQTRTSHAKSITALHGEASCAPCFHHYNNKSGDWPKVEACTGPTKGTCAALDAIDPKRIVAKLMTALGR